MHKKEKLRDPLNFSYYARVREHPFAPSYVAESSVAKFSIDETSVVELVSPSIWGRPV